MNGLDLGVDALPESVSREDCAGLMFVAYACGSKEAAAAAAGALRDSRALACVSAFFSVVASAMSIATALWVVVHAP